MSVATSGRRKKGWRSVPLITLAALLVPLAIVTSWLRLQVLDTDAYVGAVQPIMREESRQRDLVALVMREIDPALARVTDDRTAVRLLVNRSGGHAAVLDQIESLLERAVGSETFERLWGNVNRTAHAAALDVLRGEGTVEGTNGRVFTLNLGTLIEALNTDPSSIIGQILEAIPFKEMPDVALFKAPEIPAAKVYIEHATAIALLLTGLSMLLLLAGIALAGNCRRALSWAGASMLTSLALFVALQTVLADLLGQVADPRERSLAEAFVGALASSLGIDLIVVATTGLIVAIAAWVTQSTRSRSTLEIRRA
jgi:hypothetical protein